MIKISFILPCYNTGQYLSQCIESLLEQGFDKDEYEIICVDNAATDNTAELLEKYDQLYPEVKIVRLPVNQCSGGAYNAGLDIAQGKYVQFVDSDDYIKSNSVISLYELMEKKSLEMLYFNIESFNGDKELTHIDNLRFNGNVINDIEVKSGDGFLSVFLNSHEIDTIPVPAYRKIILREKLIESGIRFTPTTIGTDFVHNVELLSKFNRIAAICNKPYMFRYNPNGVTKSKMTPAKIIYALNNYCRAFEVVRNSIWSISNKQALTKEIINTINNYLLYLKDVNSKDSIIIYQKLCHISTLQLIAKGSMSKLFLNHPRVYAKLLHAPLLVKIAYRYIK